MGSNPIPSTVVMGFYIDLVYTNCKAAYPLYPIHTQTEVPGVLQHERKVNKSVDVLN
jgi:hypothetical protein